MTEYGGLPTELGWKIFIDRYTMKDQTRAFVPGDLAVVQVGDDPRWPVKELAEVLKVEGEELELKLLTGENKGQIIRKEVRACDRPLERNIFEVARRVARGLASVEPDDERKALWEEAFYEELSGLRVVPGGRIWAGAGTGIPVTLYNCFVIPSPEDSRQGIVKTLGQMIEIMSRGGGVGITVSSLRPYRAVVRGVNGRSSGAASWMELYSLATGLVEQGGCFGPDVRIATDRGLIRAEDLYARMEAGEVFRALTHEGPRRITARFANGVKKLYRVTTRRGFTVEVTAEHKMGVLRDGEIRTVPLKDLSVGDEILTFLGHGVEAEPVRLRPVNYERSKMSTTLNEYVRFPETLTPQLAYVLGYMYGDGYVHIGKKVNWQAPKAIKMATSDDYPEIRTRLVEWCRQIFGVEPVVEPGDGGCHNVSIYSRMVVEFLAQNFLLKERSEAVRVPEAIFHADSEVMGAFIAGYFDADGSDRGGKSGYGFDSTSLGMLRDIQQILAANGIMSHISTTDRSAQGWRPIHRLVVTGAEFKERFRAFIALSLKAEDRAGFRNHGNNYPRAVWFRLGIGGRYYRGVWDSTKPRISYRALSRIRDRLAADGDTVAVATVDRFLSVMPDTIVSIEPSRSCEVYDFEVAETHMLSGNGVYTSNSRRGALMLQLDIRHPDWKRFVDAKKTPGKVENANISFRITDEFMEAVKEDREWTFWFPDTSHPDYDKIWRGDFDDWERRGLPKVIYETRPAREVWNEIVKAAWESAEPGVVFSTRHEKESNSWYFNPLISTNPCAEEPLPAWGVCTLGHVNLSRFYDKERDDVDWEGLKKAVRVGVRLLDNVIDHTAYFFEENRENQMKERRIGLGTLGLGELLIRLKLRYGSPEAVDFVDKLYRFIAVEAYRASIDLAKEKGPFPAFDAELFLQSGFMQRMPEEIREAIRQHGIRNVTVLTQAPTGTVGTMLDTSTGIEPFYSLKFVRRSRLGEAVQYVRVAEEWMEEHPGEELPPYFVGAMDLTPEEHIRMQAAIQRWTDSSISKTANVPADYTVEDTEKLYRLAYELGCKGVTIYRDKSRHEQVLHVAEPDDKAKEGEKEKGVKVNGQWGRIRPIPRPRRLQGVTDVRETPLGKLFLTLNLYKGHPFELFAQIGKAGSDVTAFTEAVARLVSLALRSGVDPREVADQLMGIGGSRSVGYGPGRVRSVPDAIGQFIAEMIQDGSPAAVEAEDALDTEDPSPGQLRLSLTTTGNGKSQPVSGDLCPSCGLQSLVHEEGCVHCYACGYSEC